MKTALKRLASSAVFIAAVALAVRFAILWWTWHRAAPVAPNEPYGYELGCVAKSIASGKGFSSPLPFFDTGPTAWLSPIFPYIVAGIFKIWGIYSAKSHVAIQILNCVCSALTIFPIYAIAKRSFGASVAVGASWLWVALPTAWHIPVADLWDTSLSALWFALLFWATLALRGERSTARWVGYGVLWAVGALINTSLISVLPFFLAWLAWEAHKERMPWLRPIAISVLVITLGVVPWVIRSYLVVGKAFPVRSTFGLMLWFGNNGRATAVNSFSTSPFLDANEATEFQRLGEAAYMRAKQSEALHFMASHPARTASLVARRLVTEWFEVTDRASDRWLGAPLYIKVLFLCNAVWVLFGWLGLGTATYRRNAYAPFYWAVFLFYPSIFYLTSTLVRYRFPMDPMLTILSVFGAVGRFRRS
ncbi:MAG: glycosyltransferase family 39 protein [Candidatus Acidiferrales bacterium]